MICELGGLAVRWRLTKRNDIFERLSHFSMSLLSLYILDMFKEDSVRVWRFWNCKILGDCIKIT